MPSDSCPLTTMRERTGASRVGPETPIQAPRSMRPVGFPDADEATSQGQIYLSVLLGGGWGSAPLEALQIFYDCALPRPFFNCFDEA